MQAAEAHKWDDFGASSRSRRRSLHSCVDAGAALAQQSPPSDEGAPIVVMPMSVIEPPRDVPAAGWKSPYCAKWNDGCTECTRAFVGDETTCEPDIYDISKGACVPRGILCTTQRQNDPEGPLAEVSELTRLCWEVVGVSLQRPGTTGVPPVTIEMPTYYPDKNTGRLVSDTLSILALGGIESAERVMRAIGRDPETEFFLTSRRVVFTLYCSSARRAGGRGGVDDPPSWVDEGRQE